MKLMNHAIKFWANYNDQTAYFWHPKWFSEGIPSNMHWGLIGVNLSVGSVVIFPDHVLYNQKVAPRFIGGLLRWRSSHLDPLVTMSRRTDRRMRNFYGIFCFGWKLGNSKLGCSAQRMSNPFDVHIFCRR